MKKFSSVLLLFILSMQLSNSYAQGETFAPIGAEWYFDRTGHDYDFWGYTKSTVIKDSVIDGKTCRIINSMIVQYPGTSKTIDTIQEEAAMIVYTTPDTVYYLNKEIERFVPLYIFNVDVGDTISYRTPFAMPPNFLEFPPEDTIFRILITEVSTTEISGVPLKTVFYTALDKWGFKLSPEPEGSYMEKIGSTNSPLLAHMPLLGYTAASNPTYIRCYTDDLVRYPASIEHRACDYVEGLNTSISDYLLDGHPKIYPNPARDYVTIRNEGGGYSITSVEVYDMVGRKVKTFAFENSDQEQVLFIADLLPGTYILRIKSNEQIVNQKLNVR